jgi:hypothetical protein
MKLEIVDVKYTLSGGAIVATINGETMFVPIDLNNGHYAEIMRQVEAGTLTIQPPDYIPADVQLRNQRDTLLRQTDIPWGLADYQHPNKQAWLDYRQALRDLPETAEPQLDENGQLTNVIWPTPPA